MIALQQAFQSQGFWIFAFLHVFYMTVLWILRISWKNAGLVDWGWPSGFTAMAIYFAFQGDGSLNRKILIATLYCLCGFRFMLGWQVRHKKYGEDRRWNLWKAKWASGEGLFSVRSENINFFFFYQVQGLTNVFVFSIPLIIATANTQKSFHFTELFATLLWLTCFSCENIADQQLRTFTSDRAQRGQVCKSGFWRFSRHPNYFFEFGIWCSYALFAYPSASSLLEKGMLLLVPLFAYWFLIYFTGIPMNEKASLERRGALYLEYQRATNRFFPWFPKS